MSTEKSQSNLIFDVGMHNGRDTRFYLNKGFNVVSIEASPISCEEARINFKKEIESGQLTIYNKAISDKKGTVTFSRYKGHDDWSSVIPDWNMSMYNSDIETFQVETTNIDEVIADVGMPYYVKIDIEGSDILCLNALKKLNSIPKFISVELLSVNNLKSEEKPDYLEILCTLRSLGYTKFQLVDQSKHALTKCPNPALEGNYVDEKFDGFSSGLFGNELPNDWKSIDDVVFDYLVYSGKKSAVEIKNEVVDFRNKIAHLFFKPTIKEITNLDKNGWFDVHATY